MNKVALEQGVEYQRIQNKKEKKITRRERTRLEKN